MVGGLVGRGDSISANARPTNIHADFIGNNLRPYFWIIVTPESVGLYLRFDPLHRLLKLCDPSLETGLRFLPLVST